MTNIFHAMDHVLLVADYSDPDRHKHWAKHLLISLNGDITCFIEDEKVVCKGIIISSNVFHKIESNGNDILVYIFDETTDISKEFDEKYLKDINYHVLSLDIINEINKAWKEKDDENINKTYYDFHEKMLRACGLCAESSYIRDERIKKVLSLIKSKEEITEGIIKELASKIFLSQSRLSHLFKAETKIALSSFLVMAKIEKTYKYILSGYSITEASIKAGFHSSSHFATTNKNTFGVLANEFKKDVKVINVQYRYMF